MTDSGEKRALSGETTSVSARKMPQKQRIGAAARSARATGGFAALVAVALAIPFGVQPAGAEGARTFESQGGQVRHVVVTLFKSRTFKIDQPFSTAIVAAPEIADVVPMTDNSIYIQGKKIGTTNLSVFDPKQRLIAVLDLEVAPDTANLRDKIKSSTGSGSVHVTSSNGQVVLSGEATDAVSAERAVAVARGLAPESPVVNAMKVLPSQQVMLKVRFLEASREAGNALGVNWSVFNNKGTRGGSTGLGAGRASGRPSLGGVNAGGDANLTSAGVPSIGTIGTLAGAASTSQPFGIVLANLVNKGTSIDALVTALESKGVVRRLAEPDLIALSGDTASFLAGGEFPVPVAQTSSGSAPTITVQYKPFGVQLTFMPTVLANGLINLRLAPSVSEIDSANSVQVSGFSIPALTTREARTTVELRDGQSFAIAGLLQSTNVEDISQLPWIGSVPVLGAMFRSTSYQKHETDLVIIVTPHLVKPAAPGEHLATPFDQRLPGNDVDIFAMGQLERKKKYTEYVTGGGDLQGPYGHILQLDQSPNAYMTKK
ncbi:pilus assembly protein CpaC [Rhizobiales bacterium GAS113]|nr:pilus assembly protein CpaC [Rhizobiales bacterium GAS113]